MTEQWFFVLNIVSVALVSGVFANIYTRRRFLFVKPSIQVILALHVLVQWPLAVRSETVFAFLVEPLHAWLLTTVFMVIALAVAMNTANGAAAGIYRRLEYRSGTSAQYRSEHPYFLWLLGAVIAFSAFYLSSVQVSRLGLVVGFLDPESAAAAREESFKLIDNPLVRYVFSLLTAVLVPVAAVMAAFRVGRAYMSRRFLVGAFYVLLIIAFLVVVSLTGARYFAAATLLAVMLGILIRRRFQVPLLGTVLISIIALLPAILLTLLRQGEIGDLWKVPGYMAEFLIYRVFTAPTDVCLWYMHFAQTFEPFGIAAIPKLANVAGYPEAYAQNIIGSKYHITSLASVHANAAFLFSYYGYFGLYALPICIVLTLALDFLLPVIARLPEPVLIPILATMGVGALSFAQSDFTVSLLSHGFAAAPLFGLGLSWWVTFWHTPRGDYSTGAIAGDDHHRSGDRSR